MRYIATLGGVEQEVEVAELAANSYAIKLGERRFEADLRRVGATSFSVLVGNRSFDLDVVREGDQLVVASRAGATRLSVEDAARRATRGTARRREVTGRIEIKAAMPGRVINVFVKPGDEVKADQGLLIVEAMKMENEIKSPKPGKVLEVRVTAGQTVERGGLLVVIE